MRAIVPNVICGDGSLWMSSYKDEISAMISLFDSSAPQFFFRQVKINPQRKWWCPWRPEYILTGETWEGSDMWGNGFRVMRKRPTPSNKDS